MGTVILHFIAGTLGSLAVFLLVAYLSGERRFSAPFGVIFIGVACGAMAHFLSPWATPVIVTIYGVGCAGEWTQARKARTSEPDRSRTDR